MPETFIQRSLNNAYTPGVLNEIFPGESAPDSVTVCSGPYIEQNIPLSGRSVGDVRLLFGDRLDIDPNAQAVLDGEEVTDETVIKSGQVLTFVKKSGEKGSY